MKIWKEEYAFDYNNYHFSYKIFAERENGDELSDFYEKGFLPMSVKDINNRFYTARSFRVLLDEFEITSENKRVLKIFEKSFEREVIPFDKFNTNDEKFKEITKNYLTNVHGLNHKEKVEAILDTNLITDTVVYRDNGEIKAYVFLVQNDLYVHYWFSFYDLSLLKKSFGIWVILQEIIIAKSNGLKFMYLGTCYGEKGKYKTNFKPFEFWDGKVWDNNQQKLKDLLKNDAKFTKS